VARVLSCEFANPVFCAIPCCIYVSNAFCHLLWLFVSYALFCIFSVGVRLLSGDVTLARPGSVVTGLSEGTIE